VFHLTVSKSIPSKCISHNGESSLNLSTTLFKIESVFFISSSLVNLPKENLIELCANSSFLPNALRTYEGSRLADVHADPEDTAILKPHNQRFTFNKIEADI